MSIDKALFMDPPAQYRMNPMIHIWPEHDSRLFMEALKDYGFGGVVTNVYQEDGFTSNPKNLHRFSAIVQELEQSGLPYWVYDESGYPSGSGGGLWCGTLHCGPSCLQLFSAVSLCMKCFGTLF